MTEHTPEPAGTHKVRRERVARVPEFVLRLPLSPGAMRVYLALAGRANAARVCWPSCATLARDADVSTRTVKRALAALAAAGAIEVETRHRSNGSQVSSLYRLPLSPPPHTYPPPVPGLSPLEVKAFTPKQPHWLRTRPRAREASEELAMARTTPTPPDPDGEEVDPRRPTKAEREFAEEVLAEWGRQAGSRYTARAWIAMIARRHREHPEFALEHHALIIRTVLGGPRWWRGPATPNIVYGNAAQFERCIAATRMALTPAQEREAWMHFTLGADPEVPDYARRVLRERASEGVTFDEIMDALTQWARDPWYMDEDHPERQTFDFVLRSAEATRRLAAGWQQFKATWTPEELEELRGQMEDSP